MASLDPLKCGHGADGRLNIVEMLSASCKLESPFVEGAGVRGGRKAGSRVVGTGEPSLAAGPPSVPTPHPSRV